MEKSLGELAALVGGTLVGDATIIVSGASPIHNAEICDITFLENAEKVALLDKSNACAVVFPANAVEGSPRPSIPYIISDQVLKSFEKIVRLFIPESHELLPTISDQAVISSTAKIGKDVYIAPFVVIGENVIIGDRCRIFSGVHIFDNCTIGNDSTFYPNSVLYENCVVGCRCIIHSCSVVGAFGFGYDSSNGTHQISAQLGNVILGNDVEIGACSTVDRGTYGSTRIGTGTKVDNLVMIAHNCRIGKFNLICAHTGIAGSTTTGDYVVMAGRVGVRDHVHVGDKAVLGAMAGVMSDVPVDARWVGIPATPEKEQMKKQVALAKLPEMRKELKALQQRVEELAALVKPEK